MQTVILVCDVKYSLKCDGLTGKCQVFLSKSACFTHPSNFGVHQTIFKSRRSQRCELWLEQVISMSCVQVVLSLNQVHLLMSSASWL